MRHKQKITNMNRYYTIFLFLLAVLSSHAQEKPYKYSLFFEFSFVNKYFLEDPDYLKGNPKTNPNYLIYKLYVYGPLIKKKAIDLQLGGGIGINSKSQDNETGFFALMNAGLNLKALFGRKNHFAATGIRFLLSPNYNSLDVFIPAGYQFIIVPRLTGFLSFSQKLMTYDGTSEWIWDSDFNTFSIDTGIGYNF